MVRNSPAYRDPIKQHVYASFRTLSHPHPEVQILITTQCCYLRSNGRLQAAHRSLLHWTTETVTALERPPPFSSWFQQQNTYQNANLCSSSNQLQKQAKLANWNLKLLKSFRLIAVTPDLVARALLEPLAFGAFSFAQKKVERRTVCQRSPATEQRASQHTL